MNLFAADSYKLFLHAFGIIKTFYAHLVVDAEDHKAASCVCEGYDLLRNLFRVRELYF